VGLVGRALEEAGIATVAISMIPQFTCSVSPPRVAGVAHPFGRPMGRPGDASMQRAVLLAALQLLERATVPGTLVYLPFAWPEPPRQAKLRPDELPPIVKHLIKRPWQLLRLIRGDIPEPDDA
jgi:hypothetical protein